MQTHATSLTGSSHLAKGRVNQDASVVWANGRSPVFCGSAASHQVAASLQNSVLAQTTSSQAVAALAVSDGHGGTRYDRSDRGSAIAAWLGLSFALQVAARGEDDIVAARRWQRDELPSKFVQQWRRFVLDDEPTGQPKDTVTRYGATILAGCVTATRMWFFQVGDGDIALVDHELALLRPIESSDQLGTETESLCQSGAAATFRTSTLDMGASEAAAITLTSDGVANSFESDVGFEKFVFDLTSRIGQRPAELLDATHGWLARCSSYSGDDVSLAMAFNPPSVDHLAGEQHG